VAAFPDANGALVVMDVDRREPHTLGPYDAPGAATVAEQLSYDGTALALTDARGQIRLLDVATGRERALGALDDVVYWTAFTRDGKLLTAAGRDGTVRVFDVVSGHAEVALRTASILWTAAFSPDGKRVVAAANDGIVYVADVDGGHVQRLVGHVGAALNADFLADGRVLSSGSDGTTRIWNVGTGDDFVVRKDPRSMPSVRLSADRATILTRSVGGAWLTETRSLPPTDVEPSAFMRWVGAQTSAVVDANGRLSSP
jgi:WD40 repeat protein